MKNITFNVTRTASSISVALVVPPSTKDIDINFDFSLEEPTTKDLVEMFKGDGDNEKKWVESLIPEGQNTFRVKSVNALAQSIKNLCKHFITAAPTVHTDIDGYFCCVEVKEGRFEFSENRANTNLYDVRFYPNTNTEVSMKFIDLWLMVITGDGYSIDGVAYEMIIDCLRTNELSFHEQDRQIKLAIELLKSAEDIGLQMSLHSNDHEVYTELRVDGGRLRCYCINEPKHQVRFYPSPENKTNEIPNGFSVERYCNGYIELQSTFKHGIINNLK